jgi:hypothetical protein
MLGVWTEALTMAAPPPDPQVAGQPLGDQHAFDDVPLAHRYVDPVHGPDALYLAMRPRGYQALAITPNNAPPDRGYTVYHLHKQADRQAIQALVVVARRHPEHTVRGVYARRFADPTGILRLPERWQHPADAYEIWLVEEQAQGQPRPYAAGSTYRVLGVSPAGMWLAFTEAHAFTRAALARHGSDLYLLDCTGSGAIALSRRLDPSTGRFGAERPFPGTCPAAGPQDYLRLPEAPKDPRPRPW